MHDRAWRGRLVELRERGGDELLLRGRKVETDQRARLAGEPGILGGGKAAHRNLPFAPEQAIMHLPQETAPGEAGHGQGNGAGGGRHARSDVESDAVMSEMRERTRRSRRSPACAGITWWPCSRPPRRW